MLQPCDKPRESDLGCIWGLTYRSGPYILSLLRAKTSQNQQTPDLRKHAMTSTWTSAAEDAAKIRAALKAQGITSRQVSVKSESFSMGSSIDITIKVPGISKSRVEEIANNYERISRDDATGEILSGGNRYVTVNFDWKLLNETAQEFLPWLNALEATGMSNPMLPVPQEWAGVQGYHVGRQSAYRYTLTNGKQMIPVSGAESVAERLAIAKLGGE